jgi:hypothetical protein
MFSNVLFLSEPNLSNHTSEYVAIGITKTHKEQNTSERVLKRDLSSIMNEKKSSLMLDDLLTYDESMAKLVTFEILHNQLSKSKIRIKFIFAHQLVVKYSIKCLAENCKKG